MKISTHHQLTKNKERKTEFNLIRKIDKRRNSENLGSKIFRDMHDSLALMQVPLVSSPQNLEPE